ncbi:uncharacterized protein SETTUDRAFT_26792 [Exserohilum turcica Et28A]|uniref:DUF924-domain-containing protein n=1 Tax=Exserohilum turcicum (strain 28A) TaxID=671987 RepID=R0K6W9_EXST2|nr:uncharacterized protein SETTUDRAFT_26792 [Exserohilum turcica Et28A]EOA88738.1 hypothetical protein SETTUDRAFT_26792 [Exserohilum turcica Et28A]
MSTSSFKLDPKIFNRALYDGLVETWFAGVDTSGQEFDMSITKRWFMQTPSERAAFDSHCRAAFAHAIEAIGPREFPDATAQPFLDELQRITEKHNGDKSSEEAAWTALSMTLLLDQIPRNLYRTNDGLKLVYEHYDRMALSLVRALLSPSSSPISRPDLHPVFRLSSPHRTWFYMPFQHSEDIANHDFTDAIIAELEGEVQQLEGYNGTKMLLGGYNKAAKQHRDVLEKFGRYPHRNAALGRESTEEEKRFLQEGGATFGVVQDKDAPV